MSKRNNLHAGDSTTSLLKKKKKKPSNSDEKQPLAAKQNIPEMDDELPIDVIDTASPEEGTKKSKDICTASCLSEGKNEKTSASRAPDHAIATPTLPSPQSKPRRSRGPNKPKKKNNGYHIMSGTTATPISAVKRVPNEAATTDKLKMFEEPDWKIDLPNDTDYFLHRQNGELVQNFHIQRNPLYCGSTAQYQVHHPSVSNAHAILIYGKGPVAEKPAWYLYDLSRHGTSVNGAKVQPQQYQLLKSEDAITLGNAEADKWSFLLKSDLKETEYKATQEIIEHANVTESTKPPKTPNHIYLLNHLKQNYPHANGKREHHLYIFYDPDTCKVLYIGETGRTLAERRRGHATMHKVMQDILKKIPNAQMITLLTEDSTLEKCKTLERICVQAAPLLGLELANREKHFKGDFILNRYYEDLINGENTAEKLGIVHGIRDMIDYAIANNVGIEFIEHRCHQCNIVYDWKYNLEHHNRTCHNITFQRLQRIDAELSNTLTKEPPRKQQKKRQHSDNLNKFVCPDENCTVTFKHKFGRDQHFKHQHSGNPDSFTCFAEGCNAKYTTRRGRTRHWNTSHSDTPNRYACDECDKEYCSKQLLNNHKKFKHQGVKVMWHCFIPECTKMYPNMQKNRNRHMRASHGWTESDYKNHPQYGNPGPFSSDTPNPYACDECDKEYQSKKLLDNHKKLKHECVQDMWHCYIPECTKRYNKQGNRNRHMRTSHGWKEADYGNHPQHGNPGPFS